MKWTEGYSSEYLILCLSVHAYRERKTPGVGGDELDDLWRDHFTGSAPGSETVEDDDLVLEGFGEGGFAVLTR